MKMSSGIENNRAGLSGSVKAVVVLVLTFVLLSFVPTKAFAATYTVCSSGCDYTTINNALSASSSGDTITVSSGTYNERIDYGSKNLTIQSASGAATTIIAGDGSDNPVIRFNNSGLTSSAVLDGFTINNGTSGGSYRRGIYIGSSAKPTIQNSIIKGNKPSSSINGAGIYITGGSSGVTLTGSTVGGDSGDKNTSSRGPGLYATTTSGSITISNSTFTYNSASVHGGALYFLSVSSTPTITNTTIDNNTASQYGGAIFSNNSPFTITGGSLSNNTSTYDGGAIYMNVSSNTLVINGSTTMNNNTARAGGAIYTSGITSVDITGGSLSNNTGTNDGGAIYSTGGVDFVITDATINNNTTNGYGGGIYSMSSGATLTISKSFIQGNSCRDGGCGIYGGSGTTSTVTSTVITGNRQHTSSWNYGGGMYNAGTLYMYNSTIAGNYAYDGGGISASGIETIRNTIIYGNTAGYGSNNNVRSTIGTSTNNNIGNNARFVDLQQATSSAATTAGDYRLCYGSGNPAAGCGSTTSPDIDFGNSTNAPSDDIVGTVRPQDVAGVGDGVNDYDRGAYEHIAADITPPANITGFSVADPATSGQLDLTWTNPGDADFSGVKIVRATGGSAPSDCTGTAVYDGSGTSYSNTGLTDNTLYSYRICSYDTSANYASGVTGSGTPTDAVPPSNVTGLAAIELDSQVDLSWTNPVDADYAGTRVLRKTGSYPSSCTDGSATTVYNNTGTSYSDTSLTNGTTYYYRVCSYDTAINYPTGVTVAATPFFDGTPPADVTGFSASNLGLGSQLSLSWTNPVDTDFAAVKIVRVTGGSAPSDCTGSAVYDGSLTSYTDTGLVDGTLYSYRVCSYDNSSNYAAGVTGSATPTDTLAPSSITGFTATSGNTQVTLTWTNPVETDFAGTKILRKTGGYPSSCTDGTATTVYNSTGTTVDDTGLTNETTYYYIGCSYDEIPNYGTSAAATATPSLDTGPPAKITDLSSVSVYTRGIKLTWTAPGDDGSTGTATSYDMRYTDAQDYVASMATYLDVSWGSLEQAVDETAPLAAGSTETLFFGKNTSNVKVLPNTSYYSVIKTRDDLDNISVISNEVGVHTAMKYGYNYMSIPFDASTGASATLQDLLGDDVPYVYIFKWTPTGLDWGSRFRGRWTRLSSTATVSASFSNGSGYYMYVYSANSSVIDEKNSGGTALVSENTDNWAKLDMVQGRNLVGNPYTKNVDFSNIKVCQNSSFTTSGGCSGGTINTFVEAVTAGWMDSTVAYYGNATTFTTETCSSIECLAELRPWWGQWVYLLQSSNTYMMVVPKP